MWDRKPQAVKLRKNVNIRDATHDPEMETCAAHAQRNDNNVTLIFVEISAILSDYVA